MRGRTCSRADLTKEEPQTEKRRPRDKKKLGRLGIDTCLLHKEAAFPLYTMKMPTLHKGTCADFMARTRPRRLAESRQVANLLSAGLQQGNALSSCPGEEIPISIKKKIPLLAPYRVVV